MRWTATASWSLFNLLSRRRSTRSLVSVLDRYSQRRKAGYEPYGGYVTRRQLEKLEHITCRLVAIYQARLVSVQGIKMTICFRLFDYRNVPSVIICWRGLSYGALERRRR